MKRILWIGIIGIVNIYGSVQVSIEPHVAQVLQNLSIATHRGNKSSLNADMYQAVYMLNPLLVKSILAQQDALALEEKEHLLGIIRRRVDMCNNKKLSGGEKFETGMLGIRLILKGLFVFWIAHIVQRVKEQAFEGPEYNREREAPQPGWASRVAGAVKDKILGTGIERKVLSFLAGELTSREGLTRLMYLLQGISGGFCLTGVYKLCSLIIHFGQDQDAQRAEEIEYMISSMPIRT
jgi:hypothetical protein